MRKRKRNRMRDWRPGRWLLGLAVGLALSAQAGPAGALDFTLDVEFDDGLTGAFADITVLEEDNGLAFEIVLLEALGADADLHRFYFNLVDDVPALRIESDDDVATSYTLLSSPAVAGGAGSTFDWGVSFDNGAGPPGNGVLQTASFRVLPVDPMETLGLSAFTNADTSWAYGGSIEALAALHVQGTSLVSGVSSETVGGTVPEPSTAVLLCTALAVAARAGHRR